jgi:hypothetical protein
VHDMWLAILDREHERIYIGSGGFQRPQSSPATESGV